MRQERQWFLARGAKFYHFLKLGVSLEGATVCVCIKVKQYVIGLIVELGKLDDLSFAVKKPSGPRCFRLHASGLPAFMSMMMMLNVTGASAL